MTTFRNIKTLRYFALVVFTALTALFFTACGDDGDPVDTGTEKDANFVSFSFAGIVGSATIDQNAKTVTATAGSTVDLTTLAPDFTLSLNATAKVGAVAQASGTTQNDFTNAVTYTVTSGDGTNTQDWTVTITKGSAAAYHAYPFEEGIVHQTTSTAGVEIQSIVYVDKWGEWTSEESTVEIMGFSSTTRKITKGKEVWNIDMNELTATHTILPAIDYIDLENMTDETKEEMKNMRMEIVGEETYLGYKCKKVVIKDEDSQVTSEALVYGNMVLKMKAMIEGIEVIIEVTKIEKTTPPAEKFEVPAGVTITEI